MSLTVNQILTSKRRISDQKYNSMENTQIITYRENKKGRHKEENERHIVQDKKIWNTCKCNSKKCEINMFSCK